jgi:hypothetical protein
MDGIASIDSSLSVNTFSGNAIAGVLFAQAIPMNFSQMPMKTITT